MYFFFCFNLTCRMFGVDGKGTYDKTEVLRQLKLERTGRGKYFPEILDLVTKETAGKKRKTELLFKNLKDYHAAEGQKLEQKRRKTQQLNISVGGSILKESLLTDYQCTPSARTMECAGRSVLYRVCLFRT